MYRARTLSFRVRLTLRWTVVFSCILAAASTVIYIGIRASTYADLDRHLRTLAGTEVASAFDQPVSPHVHELPITLLAGGTFTEKLVQVFDASGRLVVASTGRARSLEFVERDLFAAALRGDAPLATVTAGGLPIRLIVLNESYKGQAYVFAVGVVITDLLDSLSRVRWLLAIVWLVSTGTTAAVGFALASTALDPVRRITARAMEIASSDIRARLEPARTRDEIGQMTESLNALIGRLHVALDANRRFAADAAHELRSPVAAMAGEVEVTLRRERTAAEYRTTLARVQSQLASFSTLISDLMLLVRSQEAATEVRAQEIPLEALVSGSMARFSALAASRGVTVRADGLAAWVIYGEPGLLGRVFDNVIENAIRYNREQGHVVVRASFRDVPGDVWAPGLVCVQVIDTGAGIPVQEQERVFERFFRVDQSRTRHTGGVGLGLAIAREVLALFKGTIHIAASSSQGTTIEIRLPGRERNDHAGQADESGGPAAMAS